MANEQIFQFTLGPVQGFVAQARRTRDFWAGSFILSWLSATAIACIKAQGGQIKFPVPDASYLDCLHGDLDADTVLPQQGSIPNRFMATTAQVPRSFRPELVSETVQVAWQALADCVWNNDLAEQASPHTRIIWDRQIRHFWEISWVLSDGLQANLLDRRKNWRNPVSPAEPGHKCMMMDGWQELSGVTETNAQQVNSFWKRLANSGATGIERDLRESEQLCAMAFIKRRFAHHFHEIKFAMPEGLGELHGWRVPNAVPSVAFLAAAPWLARVIERAPPEAFAAFHDQARELTGNYTEAAHVHDGLFDIDIRCVKQAAEKSKSFKRKWAGLDGQLYFPTALQNPRIFEDQPQAMRVLNHLRILSESAGINVPPSPYYAILLMDGDQLGQHMGDERKQTPISEALNGFTHDAGNIVRTHNGFLVYAGGDDVLALLPLEDALPAAAALQACYREQFRVQSRKTGITINSTLSGAIEFVHFRTPLVRVLQDAHQLLDDVAKDQTGRDAIAVRVWKPSGPALQWSMPWSKALDANGQVKITALAEEFACQDQQQNGERFSSRFFFRIKQLIDKFPSASEPVLEKLLLAEYRHSYGGLDGGTVEQWEKLQNLLNQCWQWQRQEAGGTLEKRLDQPCNPHTPLLIRFLARKGLEKNSR